MNVHPRGSWLASVLIVSAMLLAGCSKDPPKPNPPAPIPHADANDIVQAIATMMSADNGGWYFTVKALCETLSVPPPIITLTTAPDRRFSLPLSERLRLMNDFALTRGGLTYHFQAGWVRNDGSITTVRDTSSVEFDALVACDGGTFANANGVTANYGFHTYVV